jgi:hypothetical protein
MWPLGETVQLKQSIALPSDSATLTVGDRQIQPTYRAALQSKDFSGENFLKPSEKPSNNSYEWTLTPDPRGKICQTNTAMCGSNK